MLLRFVPRDEGGSTWGAGAARSLAAVGLDAELPPLRRTPQGVIDYDWYLLRARADRKAAIRGGAGRALSALGRALAAALRAARRRRRSEGAQP